MNPLTITYCAMIAGLAGLLKRQHMQKHTCTFCGSYRGHTPHCPWERYENLND